MIAQFHYDESTLDRLLHDNLGDDAIEVAEHVEACEVCQARMDALSLQDLSWDQISDLLAVNDSAVDWLAVADQGIDCESETVGFLTESDDPQSIGRFARYEVRKVLGRGGMGIVMRAFDPSLGRQCAVKVLAPQWASSGAAKRRFAREAKSAAAVVHRHVVPIQTVDEHGGLPYLVMPVIEGPSLQQRVDADGPLTIIETVRIAAQIAEGLEAAHAKGLVHRDIKPANVLLENGVERVQITDFGLARAVDDASMTRSGVIAGTPQYMSPEQAHGDPIDHRSDLFSLGSVIYFMLVGRSPFRAETTMGVLNRIGNDSPKPLRSINADVPNWLEAFVDRLLAKSPDERFASAGEVAGLLNRWHAHLQQPDTVKSPEDLTREAEFGDAEFSDAKSGDVTCGAIAMVGHADEPSPSTKSYRGRNRLGVMVATLFSLFALAAGIFVIQTGHGTLRIETNTDVPVPIVIRRGDEVVEELTVNASGSTLQLKAGQYVIEVKDPPSEFKTTEIKTSGVQTTTLQSNAGSGPQPPQINIIGNRVKLSRGQLWVATIDYQNKPKVSVSTFHSAEDVLGEFLTSIDPANPSIQSAERLIATLTERRVRTWLLQQLASLPINTVNLPESLKDGLANWLRKHLVDGSPTAVENLHQHAKEALKVIEAERLTDIGNHSRVDQVIRNALRNVRSPEHLLLEIFRGFEAPRDPFDGSAFDLAREYRLCEVSQTLAVAVGVDKHSLIIIQKDQNGWRISDARYFESEDALNERLRPIVETFDFDLRSSKFVSAANMGLNNSSRLESNNVRDTAPEALIAFSRWQLRHDHQLPPNHRTVLETIVRDNRLPPNWSVMGEMREYPVSESSGDTIEAYEERLINGETLEAIVLRRRFLSPPAKLIEPTITDEQRIAGRSLDEAIEKFNRDHKEVAGQQQPSITKDEVLAAIAWIHQNRSANFFASDELIDQIYHIAVTHRMPEGAAFELIEHFQNDAGKFCIWSVRLRLPKLDGAGGTYAFEIRHEFISVETWNGAIRPGLLDVNDLNAGGLTTKRFDTPRSLIGEITFRMRRGVSGLNDMLDLMTEDAINEFAGLLIGQHGLMSMLAQFEAEVAADGDIEMELPEEASLEAMAKRESLFKASVRDDIPKSAELAVQKIVGRFIRQTFSEEEHVRPVTRADYRVAAGILKSPREFLNAWATDQQSDRSESVESFRPVWDIVENGDRATATNTSDQDGFVTCLELRKTKAGWRIDSLLGGENFLIATPVIDDP